MRTFHIGRNGQNLGTFPEEQIPAMVQAGQLLPTDLAWTEGMGSWEPLLSVVPLPTNMANAYLGTPAAMATLPYVIPYGMQGIAELPDNRPFPWVLPLIFGILYTASDMALAIYMTVHEMDLKIAGPARTHIATNITLFGVVSIILLILMVIFGAILHYRCWTALHPQFRITSPGKAVGFLFIPIFNLVWFILSFFWLADGFTKSAQSNGNTVLRGLGMLGLLTGIAAAISIVVNGIVPVMSLPVILGSACTTLTLLMRILFYQNITRQATHIRTGT